MENNFKKMKENFDKDIEYINKCINEDSEFGKFSKYLLETERNPYNIIEGGFSQELASNFSALLYNIWYSLFDDGNITFYTVNNCPRFSLKYNFKLEDCLSEQEKKLNEMYKEDNLYECKILKCSIEKWISLSEEYHRNYIKECFYDDIDNVGLNKARKIYKNYKCFNKNWISKYKKGKK